MTRDEWWDEGCFKVRFDDIDRDLIAVYSDRETGIAIALYALTDEPTTDDFTIRSRIDFDKAFADILATIAPSFRNRPVVGTYHSRFGDPAYSYAYWSIAQAFIALVQHFEGDGNYGHNANIILRIAPRSGTDRPTFPLETNILF